MFHSPTQMLETKSYISCAHHLSTTLLKGTIRDQLSKKTTVRQISIVIFISVGGGSETGALLSTLL